MQIESDQVLNDSNMNSEAIDKNRRFKTSFRIQYEAQVDVLKRQMGGLEEIRSKLGLSQRKMCQLLMVDPSAWTRWLKHESDAPPVIYRALQWYLALQVKIPGLTNEYFLKVSPSQIESNVQAQISTLEQQIETLRQEIRIEREHFIRQKRNLHLALSLTLALSGLLGLLFLFFNYK